MSSVAELPVSEYPSQLSTGTACEPDVARCRIREMEITGGFLDAAKFSLSPKRNCIITLYLRRSLK